MILNGESLESFPVRSGKGNDSSLPFVFNIAVEVLASAIKQEQNNRYWDWKWNSGPVFADKIIT